MSFFLAVPDSDIMCSHPFVFMFGMTADLDATLAPFRKRFPDARMRVRVVGPTNAQRVLETACAVTKGYTDVKWDLPGPTYEVQRTTDAAMKMIVDVVCAVAAGDVRETDLPPFRTVETPRAAAAASSATFFFFAHVGHAAANYTMGGCGCTAEAVYQADKLKALHPRKTVTLYSGETARTGELIAMLSTLLEVDRGFVADAEMVDDIFVPLFRAVLGPGPTGLSVRTLVGSAFPAPPHRTGAAP